MRTRRIGLGLLGLWVLGLVGCSDSTNPSAPPDPPQEVTITLLYTNDEHGWIQQTAETEGVARLMGRWRSVDGYQENGPFLILSGGDSWTGPAVSTWFQGESTVDVMNTMGYTAAAIGNHEFDFTVEELRKREAQADFPLLSTNIRLKTTGAIPDFATPFLLETVEGVKVGLVGLSSTSTPFSTFPTYVEDFDFIPYAEALDEWVPQAWDAGAEVVVVLGHICHDEMTALVPTAQQLGVSVIGGGHCHQRVATVQGGIAIIVAGWQWVHYGKVDIVYDLETNSVSEVMPSVSPNSGGTPDPAVEAVVATWEQAAAAELDQVIGYAAAPIANGSAAMDNLVTDSWMFAYPTADIVMTNGGGIRQGIEAGDITRGTIVGVLPFQNHLVALELTGAEVVDCLKSDIILAGMSATGGYHHSDGTPLKMDSLYHVVTTDYLYARQDYPFSAYDQTPYHTGLGYHQPTIDYLEALSTTDLDPLDNYLDNGPRR